MRRCEWACWVSGASGLSLCAESTSTHVIVTSASGPALSEEQKRQMSGDIEAAATKPRPRSRSAPRSMLRVTLCRDRIDENPT
jgi:hypothetical protein